MFEEVIECPCAICFESVECKIREPYLFDRDKVIGINLPSCEKYEKYKEQLKVLSQRR